MLGGGVDWGWSVWVTGRLWRSVVGCSVIAVVSCVHSGRLPVRLRGTVWSTGARKSASTRSCPPGRLRGKHHRTHQPRAPSIRSLHWNLLSVPCRCGSRLVELVAEMEVDDGGLEQDVLDRNDERLVGMEDVGCVLLGSILLVR